MTSDGLKVAGWMASDQSLDRPYAYLIVLNNGQEIGRTRLNLQERGDVTKKYGQVYNSQNSGFSTLLKLAPRNVTGRLGVILRSPNSIYVSGWHASNQSADKPYQ